MTRRLDATAAGRARFAVAIMLSIAATFVLLAYPLAKPTHAAHAPPIRVAFGPGVPSEVGSIAAGTGLLRVDVDTARFPEARCNDGTSAVFYVRRAEQANIGNWVLFLQGGGACESGTACAERWKNIETKFGANKMSSSFAPPQGIRGTGIMSRDTETNHLATWNAVFFYYCSSDTWSGTREDVALTTTDGSGQQRIYSVDFLGASIFDAVIQTLQRHVGPVSYVDADGNTVAMPDLDQATHVVLAGSSAGAGGVQHQADRLHETLLRDNERCADGVIGEELCDLRFRAVIDAGLPPMMEHLDFSQATICPVAAPCTYREFSQERWTTVAVGMRGTRTDESCLRWHAAQEWRCHDLGHVVKHVTTPLFIRQDLQDSLTTASYQEYNLLWNLAPVDKTVYGELVHDQLTKLARIRNAGVFGPQCHDHETLSSNEYWEVEASTRNGRTISTNDALWNWIRGKGPDSAIQEFEPPGGAIASCP